MIQKTILPVFVLALFLIGCTKDSPPTPVVNNSVHTDYSIDTFLIENFLFKAGSYWVYRDSSSGKTDSCYCYGFKKQTGTYMADPGAPGVGPSYYNYRCAWDSTNKSPVSFNTYQYNYWLQGNVIHFGCAYGMCTVILCSSKSGKLQPTLGGGSQYYPSLTLNGITYIDVYKYPFSNHCGQIAGAIYLKPGIGIVRSEISTTSQDWQLIRYHIQ